MPKSETAPTFILMGQEEFQLPNLEETNLDHEIAHQWLGLAVSPDYDQGNWCEGLTLYFADLIMDGSKRQELGIPSLGIVLFSE